MENFKAYSVNLKLLAILAYYKVIKMMRCQEGAKW